MLPRILEPEVMDTPDEARDYDAMDHLTVNRVFVADLLAFWPGKGRVLDVGTGTAQIPIELAHQSESVHITAIDLAEHMLALGRENVRRAGLESRIYLQRLDAKRIPFDDHSFDAVISNSIVHHIPAPEQVIAEMVRLTARGGALFVRDLLRPSDTATLDQLVQTYAGDANPHQRSMFAASLHAALTLAEVRQLVQEHGFTPDSVQQTSDRHWTWAART